MSRNARNNPNKSDGLTMGCFDGSLPTRSVALRPHRVIDKSIQPRQSPSGCSQSHHSEWLKRGDVIMCKLCYLGMLRNHSGSRRNFLKGGVAAGVATASGLNLFSPRLAAAQFGSPTTPPQDSGKPGRRYVIRGGAVMSMDPAVGDF